MSVSEEQFVKEVVSRLVAEHGVAVENFTNNEFEKKIRAAYATEGHINADELDTLAHGTAGDGGDYSVPQELEEQFPLLSKVFLYAYLEDGEEDEEEEDEDDDDEDEESDDEEEDDDE